MSNLLQGKRVVIIVAHEFEDIELLYPVLRLSEEGAKILVVAVNEGLHTRPYFPGKPVTGRFGHPVPILVMSEGNRYAMCNIKDVHAETIDGIIFPGGYSPDALRLNQDTIELVRDCHRRGKLLAAICHGPWVLISAGIMKGKRATGYVAVRDDLINAGAEYIDKPMVRDGNIVTGRVPDDLPEFCQGIIDALTS
jgi:protease I